MDSSGLGQNLLSDFVSNKICKISGLRVLAFQECVAWRCVTQRTEIFCKLSVEFAKCKICTVACNSGWLCVEKVNFCAS